MPDKPHDPERDIILATLQEIREALDKITRRLGAGDVNFATIMVRVKILEVLVYGAVSIGLIGLASTIVSHFLHAGGP